MIKWLDDVLISSRSVFTRNIPYQWFVVIVIGLMVGQEHIGVTSIIRELSLNPDHYYAALRFFRSKAWKLEKLRGWWVQVVVKSGVLYRENGMPVLIGDGTKKSKEGKKMPCVKRLHQESENSAKPSYIFGHMFGMTGVLAGNITKMFCIPLSIKIHDGDKEIHRWDGESEKSLDAEGESHVVRIIRDASEDAKQLGKSLLLLDAYYLTVPALTALADETKKAGQDLLSIIVRAKKNAVAFRQPERKLGRGRPPTKGEKVKIMELFNKAKESGTLIETTIKMYGKTQQVSFVSCDLFWGKKHYQLLRFVVSQIPGSAPMILVSNDLDLSPVQIIRLYSYRFKIECCFFNLKHTIAGFAYRFWSFAMPKLDRFAPKGSNPLEYVTDDKDKKLITAAYRATLGYVMMASIAMGLLQICSLRFADEINASPLRWLRTLSNTIPSEASTADFMRKTIFRLFDTNSNLHIIHLIRSLQRSPADSGDSFTA